MDQANREKLTNDILEVLEMSARHNAKMSMSELKDWLKFDYSWRNLGNSADFLQLVEELGFTLDRVRKQNGYDVIATYVTI